MTEGTASLTDAECNISPDDSLCKISAFSAKTRPTARCRQTVVRGSYVMLSSNTLRKATSQAGPPAGCRGTRDQCDRTTAEAPTPNCRLAAYGARIPHDAAARAGGQPACRAAVAGAAGDGRCGASWPVRRATAVRCVVAGAAGGGACGGRRPVRCVVAGAAGGGACHGRRPVRPAAASTLEPVMESATQPDAAGPAVSFYEAVGGEETFTRLDGRFHAEVEPD